MAVSKPQQRSLTLKESNISSNDELTIDDATIIPNADDKTIFIIAATNDVEVSPDMSEVNNTDFITSDNGFEFANKKDDIRNKVLDEWTTQADSTKRRLPLNHSKGTEESLKLRLLKVFAMLFNSIFHACFHLLLS